MPKKLLSVIALIVLLFTQTTGLYAAENNSGKSTAGNVYNDPNNTTVATTGSGTQTSFNNVADSLANYYINYWKDSSWDWLRRTQFSGSFMSGSSPQWTLSTIQPFNNIDSSLDKVWYGSGSYSTNTSTVNLGIGYRRMNDKHSSVYGANLFYDNQFNVSDLGGGDTGSAAFQRVGLGLEYFAGSLEATVNGYLGISAPVMVANNTSYQTWQNVANGVDLSLKSNFDYFHAPWLNLTLTGYQYFGSMPNSVMANGGHFGGISAQLGWQVTPQLSLNVGQDFGQQTTTAGFNFNLLAAPQPATFGGDPTINNNAAKDLSYKMLQQPQRNNTIMIEQYTKNNGSTVTLHLTDGEGRDLANMPVSLEPVTSTANTAAEAAGTSVSSVIGPNYTSSGGLVTFYYLTTGEYNVVLPTGYASFSSTFFASGGYVAIAILAYAQNACDHCNIRLMDAADSSILISNATIQSKKDADNKLYVPFKGAGAGYYTVDDIPSGGYAITVNCDGYVDQDSSFYSSNGGVTNTDIYMQRKASTITITPSSSSINIGNTQQYTVKVKYSDNTEADVTKVATWASSDTTVATVTSAGLATGVVGGTSNITATYGGKTATAILNVNDPVTSIAVASAKSEIYANQTLQYTATATYQSGNHGDVTGSVTWSSDNTDAATIATGGLATGVAAGTANITATLGSVSSPAVALAVKANPVTEVAVTPATASICAEKTQQYTAKATYTSGDIVDVTSKATWSSDHPEYATITESGGLATGVSVGASSITATLGGIISTPVTLSVVEQPVTKLEVSPTSSTTKTNVQVPFVATVTYQDGTTKNVSVTASWKCTNNTSGLYFTPGADSMAVTAYEVPANNPAKIEVSYGGKTATAELTVQNK